MLTTVVLIVNVVWLFVAESSQAAKSGGCFSGQGLVELHDGSRRRMADLNIGDFILALDPVSGTMVYSEVSTPPVLY